MTEERNKNTEVLGKYLRQLFEEFFSDAAWYEKSFNRNKIEVFDFLEKISVMKCSGYDENFYNHCILKLDIYKIPEYNKKCKRLIKNIKEKDRYIIFDIKNFYDEIFPQLVRWDLDVTSYVIQKLIKNE